MISHVAPMKAIKRPGRCALPVAILALAAGLLLSGCALENAPGAAAQAKNLSGLKSEAVQQVASSLAAASGTGVVQEGTPSVTAENGTPSVWLTPGSEATVSPTASVVAQSGTPAPGIVTKGSESRWITDTVHPIEYRGIVDMVPGDVLSGTLTMSGTLTIGGHLVRVGPDTDLKQQLGAIQQGAYVQVIGKLLPDGSIEARKLLVKKLQPGQAAKQATPSGTPSVDDENDTEDQEPLDDQDDATDQAEIVDQVDNIGGNRGWDTYLKGEVVTGTTGMTGTLMVDGHRVIVDDSTWVKAMGALAAGHQVHIKGTLQPDGTILASSIQWVHRTPDQSGEQSGQGNGQTKDKNKGNTGTLGTATPSTGSNQIQTPGRGQNSNKNRGIKPPTPSTRSGKNSGKWATPVPSSSQGRGNGNGNANGNGRK